ncbi:MAG: aldo/keto reductase [Rhodobacter sp.]|jgi:L-glyceraldehyde 3-phosphate reductase|nr:aldo/keto reductase [Rhodobacter sp.]MCE2747912.1 aldo/keto reductase [Rhodobacter sp.]
MPPTSGYPNHRNTERRAPGAGGSRKHPDGIPQGSRASQGKSLDPAVITEGALNTVRALDAMAQARGKTLAQMAIARVLRHGGITTALIGASRPEQVADCCGAIGNLDVTDAEPAQINQIAGQKDVNLWARSAQLD